MIWTVCVCVNGLLYVAPFSLEPELFWGGPWPTASHTPSLIYANYGTAYLVKDCGFYYLLAG